MRHLAISMIAVCATALTWPDDLKLIPQPQQVEALEGDFDWEAGFKIVLAIPHRAEDKFAASQLQEELARSLKLKAGKPELAARPVYVGLLSDPLIGRQLEGYDLSALAEAGPEGYLLLVEPNRIFATGNGTAGTFYAIQTLKQLIRANSYGATIPCVRIVDWPGLKYRGYSDDISRGPIPTMEFFKRQVRTMAEFKMNMLTLYTEHVFKLGKHPVIAPPDGITAEEVRELSDYAKQHHVELVGNFQSFGHFGQILRHDEYKDLRETAGIITPAKEESYQFLQDVYSEIAPAYESKLFNVNCDETHGLGTGPSKPLADKIGVGGVYVRHMNRIHDMLKEKHGKRMMMWGDIALRHPTIVQHLAKDTILLSWGYGARDSYDSAIEPFVKAGLEFMVCPGVSCWSRIFPVYDNAVVNIQNYVRDGARLGALGMLNTTWDDDGENLFHWNFYGTNWGAVCAWRPADSDLEAYNAGYAQISYGTPDDKLTRAIQLLTECARNPLTRGNSDKAFWVRPFRTLATSFDAIRNQSGELCEKTKEALKLLEAAREEARYDAEDIDYLIFAARRLHYIGRARELQLWSAYQYTTAAGAYPDTKRVTEAFGLVCPAAEEMVYAVEELREEYQRLWLLENRPWSLDRILGRYDALLKDLNAQLEKLNEARVEFVKTGVPPAPEAIGLALVETSRRNIFAAPAKDDILPKDAKWWDERWPSRIALKVEVGERELTDYPVEVRLVFKDEKADPKSFRVVEYGEGGKLEALQTQFDMIGQDYGNVVFLMPGKSAANCARTFGIYYDLAGGEAKPDQGHPGITAKKDGGWVRVENDRAEFLVGSHGAHIFEWHVKALNNLEITHPGRGGWSGFADSGHVDRDAPFKIVLEAAGPVMARLRAISEAAGSEKVFTFYAGKPYVEVMLASPVGFYWDYDNVSNFAKDKGTPGTAIFSNGHKEPVCGSDEQIHAVARGVTWGAKTREDGLLLANITPEVKATHMTGPGDGWGGVGIEHSVSAAHFVTFADKVEGDPAAILNAVQQTLDMRNQPRMWIGKPERMSQ